jgi:hypothetical protein
MTPLPFAPMAHLRVHGGKDSRRGKARDDQEESWFVVRADETTEPRGQSGIALPGLRRVEPEAAPSMNCSIA